MKRWLAVLMACVMLMSAVAAVAEVDLSGYSTEELYALEKKVGQEILNRVMPDGVFYEDDDVSLKWIGFTDVYGVYFSPNIMVMNKTDHEIYFNIATLALNGVKTPTGASIFANTMIDPGLAMLTGPDSLVIIQNNAYSDVGINGSKDILTVYVEIEFYDSAEYGMKVIKEVKQTIPIVK